MQRFFEEVIRRKVLPVAAAYAIGGWVFLQIGDVLIGLLDRNGPGDRDRAQQMLTEARTLSESMGLHAQTQWIDAQLAR